MVPSVTELTGPPLASALVSRRFLPNAPGLVRVGTAGLCSRVCISGIALPVIEESDFAAVSHVDGFVCEDGTSAFPTRVARVVRPSLRNCPILRHRCAQVRTCKSVGPSLKLQQQLQRSVISPFLGTLQ